MKKTISILFLNCMAFAALAQDGIGYYFDYNNNFEVFDNGKTIQLESNRVDSVKIGNNYLSYVDQKGNLVVYYNGETHTIEEAIPNKIVATAGALVYKMQQRLMVYENGEKKQLASAVTRFFAGDSIITWQTYPGLDIMAYQNGEIKTIETAVSTKVINGARAGKNIFAYSDLNYNFKIYYNGQTVETQSSNITNYQCGRNVVAFIDKFNNTFNVFYKGETKVISNQLPQYYNVCDDMISFLDASSNFYIFYNGQVSKIETYEPDYYLAKNSLITYYYKPELKVVYEGQVYTIEKFFQQQDVIIGTNSLLYMDSNNRPKYFYKGKTSENFLLEKIKKMELYRDLPVFNYGNNTIGFYYHGKLYEYETSLN